MRSVSDSNFTSLGELHPQSFYLKQFIITSAVTYIFIFLLTFVIHPGVINDAKYERRLKPLFY